MQGEGAGLWGLLGDGWRVLWGSPSPGRGSRFDDIDLPSAVKYLIASDPNLQVLGAAYLQHKCYSDSSAKKQVSLWKGGRRGFSQRDQRFSQSLRHRGQVQGLEGALGAQHV